VCKFYPDRLRFGSIRGPKTCFRVKTEHGQTYAWPSLLSSSVLSFVCLSITFRSWKIEKRPLWSKIKVLPTIDFCSTYKPRWKQFISELNSTGYWLIFAEVITNKIGSFLLTHDILLIYLWAKGFKGCWLGNDLPRCPRDLSSLALFKRKLNKLTVCFAVLKCFWLFNCSIFAFSLTFCT